MRGDAFAAMKDLDRAGGDARPDFLAQQLVRHRVVVLVDLDVVVEPDPAFLPFGEDVGLGRQRLERFALQRLEQRAAAGAEMARRPVIDLHHQLGDRHVQFAEREESSVAQLGKAGDVLVVEFTVAGVSCIGLNGGPAFKHNEAFSFQIATDDQDETDRYWNAIVGNGGQESACGRCKDKWGVSWQITPRVLTEALAVGGDEAKRAFDAMMGMKKIDVAAIKAARRG